MSTLYIRLPSRSVADNASHWITLPCPYALVGTGDIVEREGRAGLSDLAGTMRSAQRVVLLLAASDVTLLHLKVPPMSPARLRLALPNLVEDQLMSDPTECVIVAGGSESGLRTVAVVQRAWLQILLQTIGQYGARQVAALPSQLCLSQANGSAAAAVTVFGAEIDVTLRLSEQNGMGLPLMPDNLADAFNDVVQTLCAIVPTASVALYVPQDDVVACQQTVDALLPIEQRVTVLTDQWQCWIPGARAATLDLVAGLRGTNHADFDWARWRWPMALGALLLIVNIGALNFQWWRLSREAAQLQASMVQIYRSAYPNETVIVDPAAQMRQKIAAGQRDNGRPAADDFTALAAGFGAAWAGIVAQASADSAKPAIESLEFRDRSLFVKPKPQVDVPLAQMRAALASRNLTLSQSAPGIWQIRSVQ
ncbi:MAG: type II secretion system protein GspL [Pseudomonadota bacterium]